MLCLSGFELYFRWVPLTVRSIAIRENTRGRIRLNLRQQLLPARYHTITQDDSLGHLHEKNKTRPN